MTADARNASAYLRTKVLTASPEELRLMLLDGAIRFAHQGREALTAKDFEGVFNGFSQARDIVVELITTIRPEFDPELCERVRALYTFIYNQLVDASFNKDMDKADTAIKLLEYERETWAMLMQKLAEERAAGRIPPPTPAGEPDAGDTTAGRAPLSLQA